MNKERNIPGYKVTLSYTPTTETPDELATIIKTLEQCEINIICNKLILDKELKTWLENLLDPIRNKITTIEFGNFITVNLGTDDTISLPYNRNLPFNIPYIKDRSYTLEETNLFEIE